ncbi:unnamed protein product [Ranitomeya imitator]|uniref:Choline transporter-like protein n=1 Tax=Ranitomeya imitator TaxID=111125 RepID=A0ABN9M379_9NEOB|nr:unnamed protein product [Ranitomeya imitator]
MIRFDYFRAVVFRCCKTTTPSMFNPNNPLFRQIAIYGTNFCTSARNAFFLLMRNIVRVAVLDKVTDFLLFLGKLLVVGCVGILAFFFFTRRIQVIQDTAPTLNYYWVPILTVVIGSYLIAHGFFSVYGMCVDTLFLCFCKYRGLDTHLRARTLLSLPVYGCPHQESPPSVLGAAVEDLERNDGSSERPYYMSTNLQKLLNKKNKDEGEK